MTRHSLPGQIILCLTLTLLAVRSSSQNLIGNLGDPISTVKNCVVDLGFPFPSNYTQPQLALGSWTRQAIMDLFNETLNPTPSQTVPEMIKSNGYPVETHKITTVDGYQLTFYRIPYGKNGAGEEVRRPPVIVQHGILAYSGCWLTGPEEYNLPYAMANDGYDVWLSNSRGTYPSQGHVNQTNGTFNQDAYWDFSWEDMGTKDLPAAIDYILLNTSYTQVFYVGHSMGTTMFFSGMSLRPDYSQKIRAMIGLAPVAYMYHLTSILKGLAPLELAYELVPANADPLVPGTVTPNYGLRFFQNALATACGPDLTSTVFCGSFYFAIMGFDFQGTNFSCLPSFTKNGLSPTSLKALRHYGQGMLHNRFARFDYGVDNFKIYGQCTPPHYNVEAIETPIALIYSLNDALANEQDVRKLMGEIRYEIVHHQIENRHWNHLDYLVGLGVRTEVVDRVLETFSQYKF